MKKIVCDYCKKQVEEYTEYLLPVRVPISAKSRHGITLAILGYETQDVTYDVCNECREKMAILLELVTKTRFENGDITTMSVVFDEK